MKVGVYTLGCKVNTYESEYIISLFKNKGYEIANFNDICDIYIINTCTVTNQSDNKSKKIIREAIRKNNNACIVAMGCFIEANKDLKLDGVDILIGNRDKSKVVDLVEKYFEDKKAITNLYSDLGTIFEDMEISSFEGRTRAFVKIQDGCENFCTYCIIPYVRGKCRSKQKDKVISEIKKLVASGYKEIVLTGIHTGNYGRDLGFEFSKLLEEIVTIEGLNQLRISSIEITELNDEIIDLLNRYPLIANHLHIPLQAGSDNTLTRMNRKYNLEEYEKIINKIRKVRPDISITTDVIVGFPGETIDDFNNTIAFCRKIKFAKIHVFPYSPRKNTPASNFPNQLDGNTKKERSRSLIKVSEELEQKYMTSFIDKEVEVLIEQAKDEYSYGHTSNYLHIKILGNYKSGDIVKVIIKDIEYPYCLAEERVVVK